MECNQGSENAFKMMTNEILLKDEALIQEYQGDQRANNQICIQRVWTEA